MVGNDDLEDAPIFGGELPSHPFFKQQRVGSWSHGLKLEGPPSIVDGIIPRHPEVVIRQQRKRCRIIGRHPQLSPGPILPEVNLDRAVEHGFDDPRVAWWLGSIHGVTGAHAHPLLDLVALRADYTLRRGPTKISAPSTRTS